MAVKVTVNISKKVPGPQEYSSIQASCSIEAEITGQDPVQEATRLYQSAERAVDKQLKLDSSNVQTPKRSTLITASQLTLLKRLVTSDVRDKVLEYYRVTDLDQLSLKQASEAIDKLKK